MHVRITIVFSTNIDEPIKWSLIKCCLVGLIKIHTANTHAARNVARYAYQLNDHVNGCSVVVSPVSIINRTLKVLVPWPLIYNARHCLWDIQYCTPKHVLRNTLPEVACTPLNGRRVVTHEICGRQQLSQTVVYALLCDDMFGISATTIVRAIGEAM